MASEQVVGTLSDQLRLTHEEQEMSRYLVLVSSGCSLAAALLMVLHFFFFQESRRCGRRIQFCLHVADIGAACAWLLTYWLPEIPPIVPTEWKGQHEFNAGEAMEQTALCAVQGYLLVFFTLASYLWAGCFACHLHLLLSKRFKSPELYEHRYHLVAWGFPGAMVMHLAFQQVLGFKLIGPSGRPWCWMRLWSDYEFSSGAFWLQLILLYGPILGVFAYNTITYLAVLYSMGDVLSTRVEDRIWRRMLGYEIVFILSIVWALFGLFYQALASDHLLSRTMLYTISWFTPFQGALNVFAYGVNDKLCRRVATYSLNACQSK